MNEEVCAEKHKSINEKLKTHDDRLNKHGAILDKLEQDNASFKTELKNLCDNLKSLTGVMKWFIGTWVVTLLGFFIYSVENLIK
jgi:chromosome segregation ATPase